jgi:hypothetical protein
MSIQTDFMRVVDQLQDPLNQAVDHNHTDLNLSDYVFCRLDGFMSYKIGFSISPSEVRISPSFYMNSAGDRGPPWEALKLAPACVDLWVRSAEVPI